MTDSRLQRWLNKTAGDLTDDGPVVRYELWHTVEGGPSDRLDTFAVDAQAGEPSAAEVGTMVSEAAEGDAATRLGSPQRYVVLAFRSGKSEEHSSSQAFLVRTQRERLGDDSEPGTERGITTHVLRHNENVHRLLMQASEALLGRTTSELERTRQRLAQAEQFQIQHMQQYQAMLDESSRRRVEEAKELQKARRLDELMGMVIALAPLALAKLLPPGASLPQLPNSGSSAVVAADPTALGVRKTFANLSQEEMLGILNALSEPNRIAFLQIYETMRDVESAENAQKPEALQ